MKELEQLQYDYLKHFLLANNVHEQNFKKIAIIPQYHNLTSTPHPPPPLRPVHIVAMLFTLYSSFFH